MSPMPSLTWPLTWSPLPDHSVERSPTTFPVSSLILPFVSSHLPSVLSFNLSSSLRVVTLIHGGKTGAVTLLSREGHDYSIARRSRRALATRLSRAGVRRRGPRADRGGGQ